jgi:hypothetical protein
VNPARPRRRLLACALVSASLCACGGAGRLSADAPSGVDLAGTWKLDRSQSDDPEKIYEKILRQRAARYGEQGAAAPRRSQGAGGGYPDASTDPNNPLSAEAQALQAAQIISTSHLDPFDMGVFGTIPRGDVITIRQQPDEIYIFDGTTDRSFTPGAQSVVSVPEGVADQHSGWKSRAYVIDVRAQAGPETIERYHLSDDGQHLLADIQSNGGNMPSIKIKRIYARVSAGVKGAPNND